MNLDERNQQSRGFRSFRTALDLGMGSLYVVIGAVIIYIKNFGGMEMRSTVAYIVGALIIAYGGFRIFQGIRGMREGKRR